MPPRKISINRIFLNYMALIGFISILSVGYLWLSSQWSKVKGEAYDADNIAIIRNVYFHNAICLFNR